MADDFGQLQPTALLGCDVLHSEKMERLTHQATHEVGHAIVAQHIGIPVRSIVLDITNGSKMICDVPKNATPKQRALIAAAGFAADVLFMNEQKVISNGFSGYRSDSRKMNLHGFTTPDAKSALVQEAMGILKVKRNEFMALKDTLLVSVARQDACGSITHSFSESLVQ